ncbi:MAG: bifunctional phosphopantothenoylcysteine decarboxylase/phosphopantothenate--cysteine ligase CoaBC [Chitinophagaceae bacterium]
MIEGKKILVGITGSIAAYKTIYLIRLLIKAGAEVKVIMTPSSKDFVSSLTISTLSRNPVLTDLFDEQSWSNHVMLGRWADIMVIAPLSCNTLGKMANGQCDNLLMATYLSATCPVMIAPAMDEDMWKHPATKLNIKRLQSFGNNLIPVDKGELASGLYGDGRMAEPEKIIQHIKDYFLLGKKLTGKKVLVTAGPTYEAIDPVRFIGNHSSGKMGIAIAREFYLRGAEVFLVLGPTANNMALQGINLTRVVSAGEMYEACDKLFEQMDIAIMAAAVADYSPVISANEKIKKKEANLDLKLTKTKDILKSLGERKKEKQILVGFALETTNEKQNALEKLEKKNADMIVLNSLNDSGAGFGHDTNKISIFLREGKEFHFETKSKDEVARDIAETIIQSYYV